MKRRPVTLVVQHSPVPQGTATGDECDAQKPIVIVSERNDYKLSMRSRMRVKPSIRSPTYCHAIGHAVTMLNSHVSSVLDEKSVVDLDESSDGLNEEEKAQIEAVQAAAKARKQERKVAESPLSAESLKPLLKQLVKESVMDAVSPMLDRMGRQDKRIQDLRSRVTSIEYVSHLYSLNLLCLHVVYKYGLATDET